LRDLATLGLAGYRLWGALFPQLAQLAGRPRAPRDEIRALTAAPGLIEFSSRESLKLGLPVPFIYDQPLDDARVPDVCPDFIQAYNQAVPLLIHRCFTAGCRYAADDRYMCPSGFWGLRHQLSIVRSVADPSSEEVAAVGALDNRDRSGAVCVIEVDAQTIGIAASTTDPRFTRRLVHLQRMDGLFAHHLTITEERDEALRLMTTAAPHSCTKVPTKE